MKLTEFTQHLVDLSLDSIKYWECSECDLAWELDDYIWEHRMYFCPRCGRFIEKYYYITGVDHESKEEIREEYKNPLFANKEEIEKISEQVKKRHADLHRKLAEDD